MTSRRWDVSPPSLLLATAQLFKERRALRPSISACLRGADEKEKYEEGLPNNYEAVKSKNDKFLNGKYHFEIIEDDEDPRAPFRHTRFVLD